MTTTEDLQEIFEKMPKAFVPEKAAGVNATIQLNLNGDDGGNWLLKIADGELAAEEGEADSPDLTLDMDADDYVALTRGDANPMTLFMAGRIKLQGDVTLAMKFQEMFDRDQV